MYAHPLHDPETGILTTADTLNVPSQLTPPFRYLVNRGSIAVIRGHREQMLSIHSRDVLKQIRNADDGWQEKVPREVADTICERGLFAYPRPDL